MRHARLILREALRRRVARERRRTIACMTHAALVTIAVGAACVTTTTRFFLPSPANPTYSTRQAEDALRQYVQLQCAPRAEAQRPDSGSAAFLVEVDTGGRATRAELRRSSDDDILDGIFGTVAAQLLFPRDSAARRATKEPVTVDFRCAGDSAAVHVAAGRR